MKVELIQQEVYEGKFEYTLEGHPSEYRFYIDNEELGSFLKQYDDKYVRLTIEVLKEN